MERISSGCGRPRSNCATFELQRKGEKLGFHRNQVTGFPRPTKRHAASRRKVRACEPLERFRPQPTEYSRCQHRINHTIEKMLQRDYPASAAPNRFLGVGRAVS